jgi:hypothetical protein
MSQDKIVDFKVKVKEKARENADTERNAFTRTGDPFTRKHFNMSATDFLEFVRKERKFPPIKVPFSPFAEPTIPELSLHIWEQMEKDPAYKELLAEDPFAFLIELGRRFNKKLREEQKE